VKSWLEHEKMLFLWKVSGWVGGGKSNSLPFQQTHLLNRPSAEIKLSSSDSPSSLDIYQVSKRHIQPCLANN
jgi:hypothetical protein